MTILLTAAVAALALLWSALWSVRPLSVRQGCAARLWFMNIESFRPRSADSAEEITGRLAELRFCTLSAHDIAWQHALAAQYDVGVPVMRITGHAASFQLRYWWVRTTIQLSFPDRVVKTSLEGLFTQAGYVLARTRSLLFATQTA